MQYHHVIIHHLLERIEHCMPARRGLAISSLYKHSLIPHLLAAIKNTTTFIVVTIAVKTLFVLEKHQ